MSLLIFFSVINLPSLYVFLDMTPPTWTRSPVLVFPIAISGSKACLQPSGKVTKARKFLYYTRPIFICVFVFI